MSRVNNKDAHGDNACGYNRCAMGNLEFTDWLQDELRRRGWEQADLVKRSGMSQSQISRIMNGMRRPGPEAMTNIARALHVPTDEAFRRAGLLPPENANLTPSDQRSFDEMVEMIAALSPGNQRLVFDLVKRIKQSEDASPS